MFHRHSMSTPIYLLTLDIEAVRPVRSVCVNSPGCLLLWFRSLHTQHVTVLPVYMHHNRSIIARQ